MKEHIKSNYNEIAELTVQGRKNNRSYGNEVAAEYTKLSDMQFWKRYNEFKKRTCNIPKSIVK